MKFLLMPMGSAGDVHPFMGLGVELQRRGHEVTLATCGYFEELARRFQLDFEEIGSRQDFLDSIRNDRLWHPRKAFRYLFGKLIEPSMRRQWELIAEEQAKGPVVVIGNSLGFGARTARDKLGVALITVHLQPVMFWSKIDPPLLAGLSGPRWLRNFVYELGKKYVLNPVALPELNKFRSEQNVAPVSDLISWWHSPDLVLGLFPDWFCSPQEDWPEPTRLTGFPLWDESDESNGAGSTGLEELDRFLRAGSAPIAFTPGSANVFGQAFFREALRACEMLGRRGIFLTRFPEQLPESLPDTVKHVPFVPLGKLLSHCAAFVHHGGIGSCAQGIAHGIPQVVWPLAHDQFDNAARMKRMGISDTLVPRKFTAKRLSEVLQNLLESRDVQRQCEQAKNRLAKENGVARAVDEIEQRFCAKSSQATACSY